MMLIVALMVAQALAAVQPVAAQPIEVTGKQKKPKQVCTVTDVTGSRMSRRVCRDEFGNLDLGPGVKDAAPNPGVIHAIPGPAKGGLGGVPQ